MMPLVKKKSEIIKYLQHWAKFRVAKFHQFFDAVIESFDFTANLGHKCI